VTHILTTLPSLRWTQFREARTDGVGAGLGPIGL